MKKDKRLDLIIDQAIKASFKDDKLLESPAQKLVAVFKKQPAAEAIYLLSNYLKGLKRELAKTTLMIESTTLLSTAEITEIKTSLKQLVTSHQLLVTPDLLGGFRVRIGDQIYDYSVKGKLNQVKEAIYG